jgi:hypothetical protein
MAIANGKYNGKSLSLTINSIEYNMDATSVVLNNEEADSDTTTFADLAAGGAVQWFFEIEAVSDFGTGSLWNYVWANAGTSAVPFVFKPYGNATALPAKPHFTGTLNVGAKPAIGGAAGETFTFEVRFDVDGTPLLKTA